LTYLDHVCAALWLWLRVVLLVAVVVISIGTVNEWRKNEPK